MAESQSYYSLKGLIGKPKRQKENVVMNASWSIEIGRSIAWLSQLYAKVRDIFTPMDVDTGIIKWLNETNEGEMALRRFGEEYQAFLKLESRRFKVSTIGKKLVHVIVDQSVSPRLPKYGKVLPIFDHRATGLTKVEKINGKIFVDGHELTLSSVIYNTGDSAETVVSKNNAVPVSASILDVLLEFPDSFIPKKWKEKVADDKSGDAAIEPLILFLDTVYGEGVDRFIRGLSNRLGEWREFVVPLSLSWESYYRIATIEPLKIDVEDC